MILNLIAPTTRIMQEYEALLQKMALCFKFSPFIFAWF